MVACLVGGKGEFSLQRTDCADNNMFRRLLLQGFQRFDTLGQAHKVYLYLHYDAKLRVFGILLLLF
jgi:hypothetical protein